MAPQESMDTTLITPQENGQQSAFVGRLSSLPMVHSTLDTVKYYYDGTKTRFRIVDSVEKGILGNVVPTVVSHTPAIVTKNLSTLDSYACHGLELLEQRVPLIKEPAPKVLDESKKFLQGKLQAGYENWDQLIGKALLFSEEKVSLYLPEQEGDQHVELKDSKGHMVKAQQLGVAVYQRLSHRARDQLVSLKQITPHDIRRIVFVDSVSYASKTVEQRVAALRQAFEHLTTEEKHVVHFRQLLDGYYHDLKTHAASALESAEKMTPNNVKETTRAVAETFYKGLVDFTDRLEKAADPAKVNDAYLKQLFNLTQDSVTFFRNHAQPLLKFALVHQEKQEEKPLENGKN